MRSGIARSTAAPGRRPNRSAGRSSGGIAVTAWAVDQMEVFAVFPDGELWDRYWDGTSWHAWESLGGELRGAPAASSWGPDRLDVFAPGRDGRTWHRWWDGSDGSRGSTMPRVKSGRLKRDKSQRNGS